jgi:hypothetical protein
MPTGRVRVLLVILFLASLLLGSLAGCGGGGGSAGRPGAAMQLQSISTGSLAVTIGGLPSGAVAAVRVTGPANYAVDFTQSRLLTGLDPGSYVVAALPVVAGPAIWIPSPASQGVVIIPGPTAAIRVDYTLAPITR